MNIANTIVLVKRLDQSCANKLRPLLITLLSEDKRKFFRKLGVWRIWLMEKRDPNDKTPRHSINHDYTIEQRCIRI